MYHFPCAETNLAVDKTTVDRVRNHMSSQNRLLGSLIR